VIHQARSHHRGAPHVGQVGKEGRDEEILRSGERTQLLD